MVLESTKLSSLCNSLASVEQLSTSSSALDGVPSDWESSIRYAGLQITQAAGILLRLSQDIVVQAMVIFTRFYVGPEGGSLRINSAKSESIVLRTLAFDVKVTVPHHLALTYLQTLGVLPPVPSSKSRALAARTLSYLNSALFSPQLLYVTSQPTALAVAAIYLAAREVGVKLPGIEWWEVFDVDREDLGFLVVAYRSCDAWVGAEREKWLNEGCPLTVDELDRMMQDARAVS
ncbi:MAG: hypothetical protein Q9170_005835 [Blastenia crenularia]